MIYSSDPECFRKSRFSAALESDDGKAEGVQEKKYLEFVAFLRTGLSILLCLYHFKILLPLLDLFLRTLVIYIDLFLGFTPWFPASGIE